MSGSRLRKEVGVCMAKWVGLSILVALLVNLIEKVMVDVVKLER